MRGKRIWIGVPAVVLALSLLLLAGNAAAQEKIDERKAAAADGAVVIKNISGEVIVFGWDKKEIHVTGTLGRGTERLDFDVDGDRARIKVVLPRGPNRNVKGSYLEIHVPKDSRVRVGTVSADIEVSRVGGELDLESVSGDVTADGKVKEVAAESVSGRITLEVESDEVTAESVSGDIDLSGVRGDVEAESVSGDIEVSGGEFSRFTAGTVSGDIHFEGDLEERGICAFNSHSGDIVLRLPAGIEGEFELSTFSGDIDSDIGPKIGRSRKHSDGKEIEFMTGDGDARVRAETFSGDIDLEER